jgi:hypothetical protein
LCLHKTIIVLPGGTGNLLALTVLESDVGKLVELGETTTLIGKVVGGFVGLHFKWYLAAKAAIL